MNIDHRIFENLFRIIVPTETNMHELCKLKKYFPMKCVKEFLKIFHSMFKFMVHVTLFYGVLFTPFSTRSHIKM